MRQLFVGNPRFESFAGQTLDPYHDGYGDVAFDEAKYELVDVAVPVFPAPLMVNAFVPALDHGPDAFDAVRGRVFVDVFATLMVHDLVIKPFPQIAVGGVLVGVVCSPLFDIVQDVIFQRFLLNVVNRPGDNRAVTLP